MKVKLSVSTVAGAKPGEVVTLTEREGQSLVAKGYATPHEERRTKKKLEPSGESDDEPTKEA